MNKPVILLCGFENNESLNMPLTYVYAVKAAGGVPVIVPNEISILKYCLDTAHGIILVGGGDVNAKIYGGNNIYDNDADEKRDFFEIGIVRASLKRKIPILGICRGCQVINVALGGTLYENIVDHTNTKHSIKISTESMLYTCADTDTVIVNSYHHQACKNMGKGLKITARSSDGHTEAFESTSDICYGIQFHPERDPKNKMYTNIFKYFIDKCI